MKHTRTWLVLILLSVLAAPVLSASTLVLVALPPLIVTILDQIIPIAVPVIASWLFKWVNKGTALLQTLADWQKRLLFAVLNTALVLGINALGLTDVPGDILAWTQTTLEGVLGAIAAMLLYDNGKPRA